MSNDTKGEKTMRILMLGNSFTYCNGMPEMLKTVLEEKTEEKTEVVAHTRGGAYLAEHCNSETEMGARTLAALKNEKWDYVVLQEQSNAPVMKREAFLSSANFLCGLVRENGACPVFYATWAYRDGSQKLKDLGIDYTEMFRGLYKGYHEAAARNGALVADVGAAFYHPTGTADGQEKEKTPEEGKIELLDKDDYHPTKAGSMLAASEIARVIAEDWKTGKKNYKNA